MIEALMAVAAEQHLTATVTAVPILDLKTNKAVGVRFRLVTPPVVVSRLTFEGTSPDQQKLLDKVAKAAEGEDYSVGATAEDLRTAIVNVY